jgi:hypothetical protein
MTKRGQLSSWQDVSRHQNRIPTTGAESHASVGSSGNIPDKARDRQVSDEIPILLPDKSKEEAPRNVNPTVPQQSGPSSVVEKMQRKCSDSSARRRFNHAPGSILINTRVLALQSWKDCLSDHHISSPPRPSPFRERPDPSRNLIPPLRRLRNPVPAFHAFPSFQVHCPQFRLRRGAAHIPTFQWWRNGERRSGMALPRTCERAHALATGA